MLVDRSSSPGEDRRAWGRICCEAVIVPGPCRYPPPLSPRAIRTPTRSWSGCSTARSPARTRRARGEVQLLASGEAQRSFKALALTHAEGKRWLTVGLGARKDFTPERARVAAALARERAREISTRVLCWEVPATAQVDDASTEVAGALVEGTILADYSFDLHKSVKADDGDGGAKPKHLDALIVSGPAPRRVRGRRRRDRRRGGQRGARPAEPARQRPHPDGARRLRAGARRGDRGAAGGGRGTLRHRGARHGRLRRRGAGLRAGARADRPALRRSGMQAVRCWASSARP